MGAFKLGKMTFGSLFKKPETIMYPLEKKPQPEGLKGHIGIDASACILCGMCDRSCSTGCITVDKGASTWEIDRFACVQCGYCVTVCPKKCLFMNPDYAPASTGRYIDRIVAGEKAEAGAAEQVPAEKVAFVDAPPAKPAVFPGDAPAPAKTVSEAAPAAAASTAKADSTSEIDGQVEMLMALMSDEAAAKVRSALA